MYGSEKVKAVLGLGLVFHGCIQIQRIRVERLFILFST